MSHLVICHFPKGRESKRGHVTHKHSDLSMRPRAKESKDESNWNAALTKMQPRTSSRTGMLGGRIHSWSTRPPKWVGSAFWLLFVKRPWHTSFFQISLGTSHSVIHLFSPNACSEGAGPCLIVTWITIRSLGLRETKAIITHNYLLSTTLSAVAFNHELWFQSLAASGV